MEWACRVSASETVDRMCPSDVCRVHGASASAAARAGWPYRCAIELEVSASCACRTVLRRAARVRRNSHRSRDSGDEAAVCRAGNSSAAVNGRSRRAAAERSSPVGRKVAKSETAMRADSGATLQSAGEPRYSRNWTKWLQACTMPLSTANRAGTAPQPIREIHTRASSSESVMRSSSDRMRARLGMHLRE